MKTSFGTRVSRMGLCSFVDINIFVIKNYFIYFLHIFHFFKSLKSKSTQIIRPQKGNSGVLFYDTLLNFELWVYWRGFSPVQQMSKALTTMLNIKHKLCKWKAGTAGSGQQLQDNLSHSPVLEGLSKPYKLLHMFIRNSADPRLRLIQ